MTSIFRSWRWTSSPHLNSTTQTWIIIIYRVSRRVSRLERRESRIRDGCLGSRNKKRGWEKVEKTASAWKCVHFPKLSSCTMNAKDKTTKLVLWDPNTMLLAPLVKQSHRYPLSVASWDNFLQTLKKSTSSGCWATKRGIPAKAFSRSFAVILTPWAPGSSLWLMYWFFTLSSLRGCGVRRALICVTIGPSIPATTTVSPSFSFPLIRITSTVVPRPGRALT